MYQAIGKRGAIYRTIDVVPVVCFPVEVPQGLRGANLQGHMCRSVK